jgi:hypothetical protein
MASLIMYVPGGTYTIAGWMVEEWQLSPQRYPSEMARLIAAVSSVMPSPVTKYSALA